MEEGKFLYLRIIIRTDILIILTGMYKLTGAKKSMNHTSGLEGPTLWVSKSLGPSASRRITDASLANAATSWAVTLPA